MASKMTVALCGTCGNVFAGAWDEPGAWQVYKERGFEVKTLDLEARKTMEWCKCNSPLPKNEAHSLIPAADKYAASVSKNETYREYLATAFIAGYEARDAATGWQPIDSPNQMKTPKIVLKCSYNSRFEPADHWYTLNGANDSIFTTSETFPSRRNALRSINALVKAFGITNYTLIDQTK